MLSDQQNQFSKRKLFLLLLKRYFAIILILLSFVLGYYSGINVKKETKVVNEEPKLGTVLNKATEKKELPSYLSKDIDFDIFWDVWNFAKQNYVDQPVPETKLFYGALKGIVDSLGDPYSNFLDPDTFKKFEQELAGTFEGIGAEIGMKKDILTIVAPLPDSPAQKAGLLAGDKIFAINGQDTTDMSVDQAVNLIRGQKGTSVKLTIFREGFEKPRDFEIVREKIVVKSVTLEFKNNDIAYIKINHFNNDTRDLFNDAVKEILEKKVDKVILDLRNNPGGFLQTSVEIASEWIEDGVIVSEKSSDGSINDYDAIGRADFKNFKTVVLINEGSASASEIVAGALKDHNKATLVGKKTFGKGSVQELENLPDGSAVKITVAKWLTPNGHDISEEGISPDIEIDLTDEDYENDHDPQLDKALETLK